MHQHNGLRFLLVFALGISNVTAAPQTAPSGLLCNLQRHPALGIDLFPSFSWIVAPSQSTPDAMQYAYQIKVDDVANGGVVVWDSGKVVSSQSTNVPLLVVGRRQGGGEPHSSPLEPATVYNWTVVTWASPTEKSRESTPATFVTSRTAGLTSKSTAKEAALAWGNASYIGGPPSQQPSVYVPSHFCDLVCVFVRVCCLSTVALTRFYERFGVFRW